MKNAALRLTGIVFVFYAMSTVTADKKIEKKYTKKDFALAHFGAQHGDEGIIASLLEQSRIDVKEGAPILHAAVAYCEARSGLSKPDAGGSIVRALLKAKVSVGAQNDQELRPLAAYC